MLLALSLRFLFMGDASFLLDEVALINRAYDLNLRGEWADHGLLGTRGIIYGPWPTWAFQFYLFIGTFLKTNFIFYFYLNCFVHTAFSFVGLLWLKKIFNWIPNLMLILVALSPYFFQYSRMLWDNSFLIEISLLLFCASWSFLLRPRGLMLLISVFLATTAMMIHFMVTPLVAALFVLVVFEQNKWFLRQWAWTIFALVLAGFYIAPYGKFLLLGFFDGTVGGPGGGWNLKFLDGSLLGFSLLTHLGWDNFLGVTTPRIVRAISYLSAVPGLAVAIIFFYQFYQNVLKVGDLKTFDPILSRFLRIFWVILVVFAFFTKLGGHPHYFNGNWLPFFLLCSYGYYRWQKNFFALNNKIIKAAFVFGFLGLTNIVLYFHLNHGSRDLRYGPTIANQLEVVDQLLAHSGDPIKLEIHEAYLQNLKQNFIFLAELNSGLAYIKDKESDVDQKFSLIRPGTKDRPNSGQIFLQKL